MSRSDARWIFDPLPASGARRGGDPAAHAFRHDLETFVREVVQNANDQALTWPKIRFRFHEIAGKDLQHFLDAASWRTLKPHLEGAVTAHKQPRLSSFLQDIRQHNKLLILFLEDFGTEGLTGDELRGESHFRSLCKDTLYSHKHTDAAGGSYGLGKSVLWSFSGLSAVIFYSVLAQELKGQTSPRLIGRAELPSHADRAQWFSGPGWFGRPRGARAESMWAQDAENLARALGFQSRPPEALGTSIAILGFRDPTSEENVSVEELNGNVACAAGKFFWPAMCRDRRKLRVLTDRPGPLANEPSLIDPAEQDIVAPFVDAYLRRNRPAERLLRPGDVAVRSIPWELPSRRDGVRAPTGHVELVVRLADDRPSDSLLRHVALFRGPGMVVRYWNRSSLGVGVRPFHALLACGEARDPRNVTASDQHIEQFLRAAEPPGHDQWHATPRLKTEYLRGYAKALERLKAAVTAELRDLLLPVPAQGERGPEQLQKRFPVGPRGGTHREHSFHFHDLHAGYTGNHWSFAGEIAPATKHDGFRARLSLHEVGDGGTPVASIPIRQLVSAQKDVRVDVQQGVAHIVGAPSVRSVRFRGASSPYPPDALPGELGLDVVGTLSTETRSSN